MGNYFTTENNFPEVLDQEGILNLKEMLGTVYSPMLNNNPNSISNERFNEDCPLSKHLEEITVSDPEFLNSKLELISEYVIDNYYKDQKNMGIFPQGDEDMEFKCGHLSLVKPDIYGKYQDFQTLELAKKSQEAVGEIKKLFRGFSVYQFKNETLEAISRTSLQNIEDVYVGTQNDQFMLFSPDTKLEITDCLKITWWGYELNNGNFHLFPGTGGGVTLNDKGTINSLDVSALRDLYLWAENGNLNNLERFISWKEKVLESGNVWCLVDGEQEGDLIELNSFLEMIETNNEVFKEENDVIEEETNDT